MRLLVTVLIVAFMLTACMSDAPPTTIATPDAPQWSEREAIAVVQTWLSRASAGDGSCLHIVIIGLSSEPAWKAKYLGRGEWLVSVSGEFAGTWRVFEQTISVSPDHDDKDSLLAIRGC